MQTLIQLVETVWTKHSRGAPGAIVRSAVPELVRFPSVTRSAAVLIHRATFTECEQFADPTIGEFTVFREADSSRYRLEISLETPSAGIRFFGSPQFLTTGRPTDTVLLQPNCWLQIITNLREATEDSWIYRKHVFNIVHAPMDDPNVLVDNQPPIARLDRQISLW